MAANVSLRWNQDRVVQRVTRVMVQRGQLAAEAAERQVRARVSTPFPPASVPGEPPHRRTGGLLRSIIGECRQLGKRVRVTVSATAPYAALLQRGTRRMARRPFIGFPEDARLIVGILSGGRRS